MQISGLVSKLVRLIGTRLLIPGLVLLIALSGATPGESVDVVEASGNAQEAAKPAITIDLGKTTGKIDAHAFGITISNRGNEVPELTHFFRTPEGRQRLTELGVRTINYGADRDNWAQPYSPFTAFPLSYPSVMDTAEFLNLSSSVGSDAMIGVNITHLCQPQDILGIPSPLNVTCQMATPKLSKDWLSFIKQLNIRPVNYVQLGVEPYAGCQYWRPGKDVNCTVGDNSEHKIALPQEEYAKRILKWATELRKVNPKVKLGVHLQPNTYLCNGDCKNKSWDETILRTAGSKIDFVVTHQYFEIDNAPTTEQDAQRVSYYQEQRDVRKSKNGMTAMPGKIREELSKWLPSNKNIPIVVGEYNASRSDADDESVEELRMSLYGSIAVAEGYLDMVAPVKVKGVTYSGAQRVLLLDLNNLPVMISRFLPLSNPQTLVLSPAWHMLGMLKPWQGKTMLAPKLKGVPKTSFGRPLVRVFAVKKGKNVWVAVFNHETTSSRTLDVILKGATPKSGTQTVIGDTAPSMLTHNSDLEPNAIVPSTSAIPANLFKKDRIAGMTFPPHSMTVLTIKSK